MFDANEISISTVPTGGNNGSVRHCNNGTAGWRGVIRRQMCALGTQDRMHAPEGKARADTRRELQGRSQHRAFERNALFVVIRIVEQESTITAAAIDKLRGLNFAVLHE